MFYTKLNLIQFIFIVSFKYTTYSVVLTEFLLRLIVGTYYMGRAIVEINLI